MGSGEQPVSLEKNTSFEAMLDDTCGKLREKHIHHSITILRSLESELDQIEIGLDAFLAQGGRNGKG